MTKQESQDVIKFRAMAGEEDGRTSSFIPGELPLYVNNMERGDFSIYHWPSSGGADLTTTMQQTYNEDPRIGELIRTQDFRIALSHTVDKEVLNTIVLSGDGRGAEPCPASEQPVLPGRRVSVCSTWRRTSARPTNCSTGWAWRGETPITSGCIRTDRARSKCRSPLARDPNPAVSQAAEILKAAWQGVGIKTNIAAVRARDRGRVFKPHRIARDYSAYQYNPWTVQWTSLAPLTRGDLAGEIGQWYASRGA